MRTIPDDIAEAAVDSMKATGIPASVSIAQWALESGWGAKQPGNNPFGIKAKEGEPSVTFPTHEVVHGERIAVQAAFRAFDSIKDAFDAHAQLLAWAGIYAKARAVLPDALAFCDALTGRYATDPSYGALLKSIIRTNNLLRFDTR